jgi:hypothetical protein
MHCAASSPTHSMTKSHSGMRSRRDSSRAGHILGSEQIRLESAGSSLHFTGDLGG